MTARAALRYLWKEANSSWPQEAMSLQIRLHGNEGPKQSSPKEMSPEIFQTLVEKYESTTVDGRQRSFPMRLLLGAEKIVNRAWVEHHVTKQYTPLQLHEILECRCFHSSGQLNSLAPMFKTKSPHQKLTLDKDMHAVVMEDKPSWSPKGLLSILDAIEAIQWETDPTCIQISHHHYPDMEHRGNIVRDNPQAVADRMQFLDPDQSWSIAITAGPPCPDFSRIKGSQGEGRDGAEGKKFDDWLTWLEELLPLLGRRPVLRLVETQTLVDRHQLEPTRAHNLGTKGHMVNTVQHPCPSPGRAKGHTTHRSTNLAATRMLDQTPQNLAHNDHTSRKPRRAPGPTISQRQNGFVHLPQVDKRWQTIRTLALPSRKHVVR